MTIFVSNSSHPLLEGAINQINDLKKKLRLIQKNPDTVQNVCVTIFNLKTEYAELKNLSEEKGIKQPG